MKKSLGMLLVLASFSLAVSAVTLGKDKPGPLAGTWACVAHGTDQGDINYTYNLTQAGEKIAGTFEETGGEGQKADIKEGSYKDKKLNLSFEAHNGTVTITGTMAKKDAMSGDWSHSSGGTGTWDCTKGAPKMAAK